MAKECSHGQMVKCMTESGLWAKSMGSEYGKDFREIHMLVNGEKEMWKGMEYTSGKTVTSTKVSG